MGDILYYIVGYLFFAIMIIGLISFFCWFVAFTFRGIKSDGKKPGTRIIKRTPLTNFRYICGDKNF